MKSYNICIIVTEISLFIMSSFIYAVVSVKLLYKNWTIFHCLDMFIFNGGQLIFWTIVNNVAMDLTLQMSCRNLYLNSFDFISRSRIAMVILWTFLFEEPTFYFL